MKKFIWLFLSLSLITTGQALSQITPAKLYQTGGAPNDGTGDKAYVFGEKFNQNDYNLSLSGTASGTDTYAVTITAPSPGYSTGIDAPSAYTSGQKITITFTNANTGASTINVNSIGVKDIKKAGNVALSSGDIKAGGTYTLYYNGTYFQILGGGGGSTATQTITNGVTDTSPSEDAVYDALVLKQDALVSGTNIKTIESVSLVGSGNVDLSKSDVGLDSVDNTSDVNKPVSTAQQTAIDAKVVDGTITNGVTTTAPSQDDVFDALALKQDLDSDLTTIGALSPSNDDFIQRKAGAWTNRTVAQVKTDLSLTGTNSGDQVAAGVPFTPAGNIAATELQTGLAELDQEKSNQSEVINTQTGTSYTLQSSDFDNNTYIVFTNSGAITCTVPNGVGVVGKSVNVIRTHATGSLTFVEGGSQNITPSSGALTDPGEDVAMSLKYVSSNEWDLQNGNTISLQASDINDALGYTAANATSVWSAPIVKSSDQTFTSSSYTDISTMSFSITAGQTVAIRGHFMVTASNTTEGFGLSINSGATLTSTYHSFTSATSSTAVNERPSAGYDGASANTATLTPGGAEFQGILKVSTSGTVIMRLRCEIGGGESVTIKAGSYIQYKVIQ